MNEKDQEVINKILETLNSGASNIVSDYSLWFFVSAIGWVFLSIIAIAGAVYKLDRLSDVEWKIATWGIIFIFACVLMSHIPDIAAPKAAAVHQLIRDIKK